MKLFLQILLGVLITNNVFSQKVVFIGFSGESIYLDNSIKENLSKSGISVDKQRNNDLIQDESSTDIYTLSKIDKKLDKYSSNYIDLGYSYILLPVKTIWYGKVSNSYTDRLRVQNQIWWGEFKLFNLITKKSKNIKLTISTSGKKDLTLESCSNINSFSQEVSEFIQLENVSKNTSSSKIGNINNSIQTNNNSSNSLIVSKPSLMVIPNKIKPSKLINGEYELTKDEKMLIAAFKNKFEDYHFTTFGFESVLKRIYQNRMINDNVQDDIKSKILENSNIDFFVEFENLDEIDKGCNKVFDFKIRNFSTGEDVASDVRDLNSCGNSDVYKTFASSILNEGAVSKINNQFNSILKNGQKINLVFTISNTSQAKFNKEYNGIKLGTHINKCLQSLAFKGNLELQEESDLRKQAFVNIPIIDENSGQRYQTTSFAEEIITYLKINAAIECDRTVSRQSINIKIK
jgi:hypothetical protein